jgi:hypothetical protein
MARRFAGYHPEEHSFLGSVVPLEPMRGVASFTVGFSPGETLFGLERKLAVPSRPVSHSLGDG